MPLGDTPSGLKVWLTQSTWTTTKHAVKVSYPVGCFWREELGILQGTNSRLTWRQVGTMRPADDTGEYTRTGAWPWNPVKAKEQRMKDGQSTSKMAQTRTQRTYMGSGLHRTPLAAAAGFGPGGEWLRRGRGWSSVHLARNWLDLFLKSACINLVN